MSAQSCAHLLAVLVEAGLADPRQVLTTPAPRSFMSLALNFEVGPHQCCGAATPFWRLRLEVSQFWPPATATNLKSVQKNNLLYLYIFLLW